MKKIKITVSLLLIIFTLSSCSQKKIISRTEFVLNTVATISIYKNEGTEKSETIIDNAFELCKDYENILSRTIETSDIYKINSSEGNQTEVNPQTAEIIKKSIEFSELSNGAFDITIEPLSSQWDFHAENPVPPSKESIDNALKHVNYKNIDVSQNLITLSDKDSKIDLGAIAKGYIAEKLKEYLKENGVSSAIINLGGNVLTIGQNNNKDFSIAVQNPVLEDKNSLMGKLMISDKSVVTSGTYERFFYYDNKLYHHIIDPNTGYPVDNNLLSVTIISDNSTDGDALSTSAFILGLEKGIELIEGINGVEAIFITNDNKMHFTSGIGTDIIFEKID